MKTIGIFGLAALAAAMTACGGNGQKTAGAETTDETDFQATQPLESGMYDASYFEIKGADPKKGQFDGRVIAAISPEQNALYVYENGNRTKIKHVLVLEAPFEKSDSVYTAMSKGKPVTLAADSADYVLNYITSNDTVSITFSQKARSNYTALEALEKISASR